jgi:uridine kinase
MTAATEIRVPSDVVTILNERLVFLFANPSQAGDRSPRGGGMQPIVIGIAGGTASGKSTVATALTELLGSRATLLEHDRYYRTVPPGTGLGKWNFDHPDSLETELMREHVAAWRQGRSVRVPTYDFATQRRLHEHRWHDLHPGEVLVVEGILVLSDPELRAVMTHKVYVHTPNDIRLARRLERDIRERGRGLTDILEQYMATVRPMHEQFVAPSCDHADLVLSGLDPVPELVSSVLRHVGLDAWRAR